MDQILEFISQPWHWAASGLLITVVMLLLLYFDGEFGVSGNLRTLCAIGGAGKRVGFFNFDWKKQTWNLVFIAGAVVGGFIAFEYLASDQPVQIAQSTSDHLQKLGIETPQVIEEGHGFVPMEIFGSDQLFSLKNILFLVVGGFLVGFGTRWAGGCTSGHAISGLSNLQIPSLIAVIGFFIGGLLMSHFILPLILG
jgi:uncharacterized protein